MVNGMKKAIMVLVAMILVLPAIAEARVIHGFACNQCHKPGVSYTDLGNTSTNICLSCHNSSAPQGLNLAMGQGWINPNGLFQVSDGSNAMGAVEGIAVSETSHLWAGNMADGAAAGAAEPTTYLTELNGRYGISRGKVTCSRCHDPHGDNDLNTLLLKVPMDNDELCKACHAPWAGLANDPVDPAFNDGLESHPMVADFATTVANRNSEAAAASEPQDPYKTAVDNTLAAGPNGDIRLVNGAVSCTSCHHLHFTDSDSTTVDGRGNQTNINLNGGDGMLLRTDGASRANKSALCQACHNYLEHGDDGAKNALAPLPNNTKVGCLECHSGHSFNNNDPQYYVLRSSIGAPYNVSFAAPFNYSLKPTSHDQTTPWNDGVGTANGYCEKCHGDASAIGGTQHNNAAKCLSCHFHNSAATAGSYSFQPGANVEVCGDCHGFPPHLNARGDRTTNPDYEGGYAYLDATNNYQAQGDFKDETATPHSAHAGAGVLYTGGLNIGQPIGPDTDYRMGDGEVACSTCHGTRPSHENQVYDDIEFDARATVDGQTPPAYDAATRETCTNVYCHSNGGRRNGDNPTESTRLWSFVETPYTGNPTNSGWKNAKGTLINPAFGNDTECSTCHGNDSTDMNTRGNSVGHKLHLDAGYTCNVCHVYTATSNTTVPKEARDVSKNAGNYTLGTHVNNKVDVYFDPAYTPAIGSGTYTAGPGTCAVYCHSNGGSTTAPLVYATPDWDAANGAGAGAPCGSCHGNPPASGNHAKHVTDANGPLLTCDACHDLGTGSAGSHSNHIDGTVNKLAKAASCDACHGYDGTPSATESEPIWGNSGSVNCTTCHTGTNITTYGLQPNKDEALATGHNRPAAAGAYAVSGNGAAALNCEGCHDATAPGHFDGDLSDKRLNAGFSCDNCHGPSGSGATKKNIYTHQAKGCTACHDPHGDAVNASANIFMVRADSTGNYTGTVVFTNRGNSVAPLGATNSFDEDDDATAGFTPGSEVNGDDLCATCHTNAGSLTLHNNQQGTDNTSAGGSHNLGKNCFDCHLTHTEPTGAFAVGGGDSCESCHGAGMSNDIASQPVHQAHTNLVPTIEDDRSDCVWCHPNAGTYTYTPGGGHSDAGQRVTDLGTTVGYSAGDGSCAGACHNSSAGDGFWGDANGLSCGACHGVDATGRPGDASHTAHVVTAGKACTECHVVNSPGPGPLSHIDSFVNSGAADDGTAISDKATATGDEATVSRTSLVYTRPTCSGGIDLGCHATGTPQWNVSTTADNCIDCHTNTTDATVNPNSGLHFNNQSPTVSAVKHDSTLTGGCEVCHTTINAQATHKNGLLNADGSVAGDRTAMGLFGDYTNGGVNNVGTCSGGTVGGASCHAGGDGGTWARKWDSAISYQSNGTECKGCHGGFGITDWTFGSVANPIDNIVEHNRNWDGDANPSEVIGNHSDNNGNTTRCNICHVYSDAGYTWATNHRNGQIEMNSSMGYSTGSNDCTNTCHSNNANHNLEASGWTVNPVAGPVLSCYTCHGNGSTDYWPSGSSYPNRAGEHPVHIAQLAAKLGLGAGPYTQAQQQRMCAYCHSDITDIAGYGGQTGHADGSEPADVGAFNPLWDTVDPPTTADADATEAAGACSNVDCHNNKATTPTYDWYAGAASACAMCHNNGEGDATHTAHLSAGMGVAIDCLSCHGAGTSSTTPPSFGHIGGTLDVTGNVTFTYTGGMTGTCGTNDCHNSGRYATGVQQAPKTTPYNWGTPISSCDACHETTSALATGSHTAHLTTTSQSIACSNCHAAETLSSHIDAAVNFTGAAAAYNSGTPEPVTDETFSTCGTNTCHNNGKNATPYNNGGGSYTWNTAIGGVNSCTECHNNGALGELHSTHLNAAAIFGITTIACDSCHNSGAAAGTHSGHVDATVTLATLGYSGTPNSVDVTLNTFGSCNTLTCHNNGLGSAVPTLAWNDTPDSGTDCTTCHGNAGSNLTSKAHPTHIATSAQSGKAWGPYPTTGSANCGECHAAAGTNDTMATYTTHIDGTINFAGGGNLAATSACNNCHGGAVPATTAKANWTTTPTRVSCESCHGDYTNALIGGKTAPHNAGTGAGEYTQSGHGKTGVVQACTDCHDNTAAGHIDGTSGDDKRLKTVNSQTYGARYAVASIDFCGLACHATSMKLHYTNGASGTSYPPDNQMDCITCHNPHGQNLDATSNALATMIRPSIDGKDVVGFYSKSTQNNYFVDPPNNGGNNRYGICQVCHVQSDSSASGGTIGNFNQSIATPTHQGSQLCTDCHKHTDDPAFQAGGGGCNGCHGYPPVSQLTGAGAAYATGANLGKAKLEDYDGGGRAHAVVAHINPATLPDPALNDWTPCAPCHTEGDHNPSYGVSSLQTPRDTSGNWGTSPADVNYTNRYPRVQVNTAYNKGGTAFYNMAARDTTDGMGRCSNITCHFSESPKWDCDPVDKTNDPQ